jgi:hypothetical protein
MRPGPAQAALHARLPPRQPPGAYTRTRTTRSSVCRCRLAAQGLRPAAAAALPPTQPPTSTPGGPGLQAQAPAPASRRPSPGPAAELQLGAVRLAAAPPEGPRACLGGPRPAGWCLCAAALSAWWRTRGRRTLRSARIRWGRTSTPRWRPGRDRGPPMGRTLGGAAGVLVALVAHAARTTRVLCVCTGGPQDLQGIPWERLHFTRAEYRETRLAQYRNYTNLLPEVRAVPRWGAAGTAQRPAPRPARSARPPPGRRRRLPRGAGRAVRGAAPHRHERPARGLGAAAHAPAAAAAAGAPRGGSREGRGEKRAWAARGCAEPQQPGRGGGAHVLAVQRMAAGSGWARARGKGRRRGL